MPWLTWRSSGSRRSTPSWPEAVPRGRPGAVLAVATPGLDDGPAGPRPAGSTWPGSPRSQAWRAVGLDLETWPDGDGAPVVLRGVGLSTDDLGARPGDQPRAGRPGRRPAGPRPAAGRREAGDGRSGRRPARGDRIALAPDGPAAGRRAGRRRAAGPRPGRARRPLGPAGGAGRRRPGGAAPPLRPGLPRPAGARRRPARLDRQPFGRGRAVAGPLGGQTYLALANDTPYPIRLETVLAPRPTAAVDDLGRGAAARAPAAADGRGSVWCSTCPRSASPPSGSGRPGSGSCRSTPYPAEAVGRACRPGTTSSRPGSAG